jgi:hypothetical protein
VYLARGVAHSPVEGEHEPYEVDVALDAVERAAHQAASDDADLDEERDAHRRCGQLGFEDEACPASDVLWSTCKLWFGLTPSLGAHCSHVLKRPRSIAPQRMMFAPMTLASQTVMAGVSEQLRTYPCDGAS